MEKNVTLQEEHVPLKSRIWVSLADSSAAILGALIFNGLLTYYFTRWRGLDYRLASLVWIIFGVWNAVNDPLFGYISDRTKSRLGRRIPYIRYGAPLYALVFVLCWVNWRGSQTGMFLQMLAMLFLFDTLYTSIATSIYVMPYEMAVSNKARSSIFIWKIVFMVFPTAIPLVLVPIIQPGPGEDATAFRLIMTVLGVFLGLVIYASTFFYKENHYAQDSVQFGMFRSIWECLKNRSFLVFEVASFTIIYVQTALLQGVGYYFDELKVPGTYLFAAIAAGIILGVMLWLRVRERWGVKRCAITWCLLFALGCAVTLLFGSSLPAATLGFFLFGIGFSGGMYLIPIVNGDVIDVDEHRTGLRREGMYAGVNSLITKPAISIAQAVFLAVIHAFGYNDTLAKGLQPHSAQQGILIGWLLVPAGLLLLSGLVMFAYPLHGKRWLEIKSELARKHQEKEREHLAGLGYAYSEDSRNMTP